MSETTEHGHGVRTMFDRVARRYDLMNGIMTFGRYRAWHRFVAERAAVRPGEKVLDIATGTGDIALAILKRSPGAEITGADFSAEMMAYGRSKPGGEQITWVEADALALPFEDQTFNAVTSGYLLRNVGDIPRCLAEKFRVLQPGGRAIALESAPPPRNILRPFILAYLRWVIPVVGGIVTGNKDAYSYLPSTTAGFHTPAEVEELFRGAGFTKVGHKGFMFGTVAVYWGRRPAE